MFDGFVSDVKFWIASQSEGPSVKLVRVDESNNTLILSLDNSLINIICPDTSTSDEIFVIEAGDDRLSDWAGNVSSWALEHSGLSIKQLMDKAIIIYNKLVKPHKAKVTKDLSKDNSKMITDESPKGKEEEERVKPYTREEEQERHNFEEEEDNSKIVWDDNAPTSAHSTDDIDMDDVEGNTRGVRVEDDDQEIVVERNNNENKDDEIDFADDDLDADDDEKEMGGDDDWGSFAEVRIRNEDESESLISDSDFARTAELKRRWHLKEKELRKAQLSSSTSTSLAQSRAKQVTQIFSSSAATQLLTNAILDLIRNGKSQGMDVTAVNDSVFTWRVAMRQFPPSSKLAQDLALLAATYSTPPSAAASNKSNTTSSHSPCDSVEIELDFDMNLFPFYPPSVRLVRPRLRNFMMGRIVMMKEIQLSNWNPLTRLDTLLASIHSLLALYGSVDDDNQVNDPNRQLPPYTKLEYSLLRLSMLTEILPRVVEKMTSQDQELLTAWKKTEVENKNANIKINNSKSNSNAKGYANKTNYPLKEKIKGKGGGKAIPSLHAAADLAKTTEAQTLNENQPPTPANPNSQANSSSAAPSPSSIIVPPPPPPPPPLSFSSLNSSPAYNSDLDEDYYGGSYHPSLSSKSGWKKGTGYGSGSSRSDWDVSAYLAAQKKKELDITEMCEEILSEVISSSPATGSALYSLLESSCLLPLLESYFRNDSITDMQQQHREIVYHTLLDLCIALAERNSLLDLLILSLDSTEEQPVAAAASQIPSISSIQTSPAVPRRCVYSYLSSLSKQAALAEKYNAASAGLKESNPLPLNHRKQSSYLDPFFHLQSYQMQTQSVQSLASSAASATAAAPSSSSPSSSNATPSFTLTISQHILKAALKTEEALKARKEAAATVVIAAGSTKGNEGNINNSDDTQQLMEESPRRSKRYKSAGELALEETKEEKKSPPVDSSTMSSSMSSNKTVISIDDDDPPYVEFLSRYKFGECSDFPHHHYMKGSYLSQTSTPFQSTIRRLASEYPDLSRSLPCTIGSSCFLRIHEEKMQYAQLMIAAPTGTPYSHGLFLFDIAFPPQYPSVPPLVNLQTTGGGTVRFNPNLYNEGKVCLSLLGTWSGSKGESWSADTSTFLQVAVSIQSLILVDEPYFNEPGYESQMNTPSGKKQSDAYNANIQQATIKFAMIEQMKKPPAGWEKVIAAHFYLQKAAILAQVKEWAKHNPAVKTLMPQLKEELEKQKLPPIDQEEETT